MRRKGYVKRDLPQDSSHAELLEIHKAVMCPAEVVINGTDTYTVKRVKEFILAATRNQ